MLLPCQPFRSGLSLLVLKEREPLVSLSGVCAKCLAVLDQNTGQGENCGSDQYNRYKDPLNAHRTNPWVESENKGGAKDIADDGNTD